MRHDISAQLVGEIVVHLNYRWTIGFKTAVTFS